MANNYNVTPGTGLVIGSDEVGNAHYQKIKLADGEDDSGIMILAGAGDIANALRVVLGGYGLVTPFAEPDDLLSAVSSDIIDTTGVELIAAQGEGVSIFINSITVTNNDPDVATVVKLRDGDGGTVKFRNNASEDGGGFSVQLPTPIKFSPNTAVYVQCETADANVQVSISGYKGG